MPTTAEMLLKIAECLLMPRYGAATANGAGFDDLEDATLDEPDELFNGGTIWILTGRNAGMTRQITDWDLATHTFTVAPILPDPIFIGDQYAALDARYPRDLLVGALNQALQELGPFDASNIALTTIDGQLTYALPAGVSNVKRLQYSLETVPPYTYGPPDHWWEERNGTLYISPNHLWDAGCNIRLWYEAPHTRVYQDTNTVTDAIHPMRIAWQAALAAVRQRLNRADTRDTATAELEKKCEQQALALQRQHPIRVLAPDQKWNDLP